jgi:uncharacterized protein
MIDFSRIDPAGRNCTVVVDGPNIDQSVARCRGRKPTRSERMRHDALHRWQRDVAAQRGATAYPCFFTNIPSNPSSALLGWVRSLVQTGWHVFAKPKATDASDVDSDMLTHLSAHPWTTVIVVSHDARCFARPLAALAAKGTEVIVVGMAENAGCLPNTEGIVFIDIDDIPDLFDQAPPRVRLTGLPEDGIWYHPTGDRDSRRAA